MNKEERLERIQECKKFDRCSFSVCPLDPGGNGCYIPGDLLCPLVPIDSENKESPFRKAVREKRSMKKTILKNKALSREIVANKKLRECQRDKTNLEADIGGVTSKVTEAEQNTPQQVRFGF